MRGPGEARLLASGALLQQVAQGSGLVALLVIVTLLARRLDDVAELGAYGLVSSLSGYLLVLRNSVAAAAVRAMAGASPGAERTSVFVVAARLYALVGAATGLLIAVVAVALAGTVLDGELASDARIGGFGLGALIAVGIAASINLDRLRAERMFPTAAKAEIAAVVINLALMVTLILGGADLSLLIALSGALPLLSGLICALLVRRFGLGARGAPRRERHHRAAIIPTAGWLLVIELANLAMYASGRIVLGAYRTPTAIGLYEGPVRAHNLLYALGGALAVPTVPTASRYVAEGDHRRLGELAVRGSRYTLALFVPLSVTLMTLAEPILAVWLGDRYTGGAAALTIIVSYWLVYGALILTPGFLAGAGEARGAGLALAAAAALNLVLALLLTPELGVEGPAIATAAALVAVTPVLLRAGLRASGVSLGRLLGRAAIPAYTLGALLAGTLLAVRYGLEPETLPAVASFAVGGPLAYWAAFYALVLDPGERALVRGLLGSARGRLPAD
ncbi:MAG TPA: oligosaccharide flippase family protein [Thermoleophilaceae bacterium]|nr:oligosaccharide flippase family protein [Thermoleophilaceae bacterium]